MGGAKGLRGLGCGVWCVEVVSELVEEIVFLELWELELFLRPQSVEGARDALVVGAAVEPVADNAEVEACLLSNAHEPCPGRDALAVAPGLAEDGGPVPRDGLEERRRKGLHGDRWTRGCWRLLARAMSGTDRQTNRTLLQLLVRARA